MKNLNHILGTYLSLSLFNSLDLKQVSDVTIGQWPLLVKKGLYPQQEKVVPTARKSCTHSKSFFFLAVGTTFTCCGYEPFLDTGNKHQL